MSEAQDERSAPLLAILDDLVGRVQAARAMPMSASVLVNRAEVLDLLDAVRDSLPDQISAADDVIADADAVLARAQREAERALAQARTEAERLTSQEAVVAQAEARAAEIVAAAEETAERLQRDADDYCDKRLAQFEIDLDAVQAQVHAGRARLAERARNRPEEPDEDD
ncbi:conserved hypothetical protein [Beutenbergia cavernae DSM 12333]|uniref:ATPase n=1 Tax=Beutenbergia cavernae (strain ATCC BAA-8 / DSM 12333 / CCUG 43141 / JCM 11478 / NBRC 16432 / NCIMB 13614 / HKI 0122) TaxID=471853 RepID=C5C3G3_BEUC1|nr:hypothetical protein [Beutenbergia cavernae]ACQ79862.1 conserved hypothetical protein [Beutenbergia cavernae DSM 12333]